MTGEPETATPAAPTDPSQISGTFCLLLIGLLLASLAYTSISRCKYTITGDSRVYFGEARHIRHGYIRNNIAALRANMSGGQAEHLSLRTEGGYAFLLAAARMMGERAPFLVNGILLPLMLLALMLLASALSRDRNRAVLSGLFVLLFILIHPRVSNATWQLTVPLRDTLAHLLGILGLLVCVLASRGERHRELKLMAAGTLIGLASWSRMTDALLIVPAALYTVADPGPLSLRKRAGRLLWLGAGMAIGLCPLAFQNIIEGRAADQPGKMAGLIRESHIPIGPKRGGAKLGIRLSNFPIISRRLLSHILSAYPAWFRILTVLAVVTALLRRFRQAVLPLTAAAVLFAFYGCYSTVVPRYTVVVHWFVILLPALFAAGAVSFLLKRVPWPSGQSTRFSIIGASLTLATALLCLRQAGDLNRHRESWETAMRFRTWLSEAFDESDLFIARGRSVPSWMWYFADRDTEVHTGWRWTIGNTNPKGVSQERKQLLDKVLDEGRKAYFINTIFEDGCERRSWWKDDIQNHYRLVECKPTFDFPNGESLVTYRIVRPQAGRVTIPMNTPQGASRALFLWTRALATSNRWQEIVLSNTNWPSSATYEIQNGPNILTLPHPLPPGPTELTAESADPMPTFLLHKAFDHGPVVVSLRDHESAPSLSRGFTGLCVAWSGYKKWWRDLGGIRNSAGRYRKRSTPEFRISSGSTMRIPRPQSDLHIGAFLTARSTTMLSSNRLTEGIGYVLDGRRLTSSTTVHARSAHPRADGKQDHVVDFAQSIIVPSDLLSASTPDLTFNIGLDAQGCTWLHIWHVNFRETDARAGEPTP